MLRHQGTIIAFALDNQQQIHYSVLNVGKDKRDDQKEIDAEYWLSMSQELQFPSTLVVAGPGINDVITMPSENYNVSTTSSSPTTAWLTADVPFQVLSDGQDVYIFRQSTDAISSDYHTFDSSYQKGGKGITEEDNTNIPVIEQTLLLDRFVLVESTLKPKLEIRYRRSRHKNRPQSNRDTLGTTDMENNPFYEPTLVLRFIRNLSQGRFSVLLLPTQSRSVYRWQIFAYNSGSRTINSFNIARSNDGLFNMKETQRYNLTSESGSEQKPKAQKSNGIASDITDESIYRSPSNENSSKDWALAFNGQLKTVAIDSINEFPTTEITLECWLKAEAGVQNGVIISYVKTEHMDESSETNKVENIESEGNEENKIRVASKSKQNNKTHLVLANPGNLTFLH